jgi:hypothetical protein
MKAPRFLWVLPAFCTKTVLSGSLRAVFLLIARISLFDRAHAGHWTSSCAFGAGEVWIKKKGNLMVALFHQTD